MIDITRSQKISAGLKQYYSVNPIKRRQLTIEQETIRRNKISTAVKAHNKLHPPKRIFEPDDPRELIRRERLSIAGKKYYSEHPKEKKPKPEKPQKPSKPTKLEKIRALQERLQSLLLLEEQPIPKVTIRKQHYDEVIIPTPYKSGIYKLTNIKNSKSYVGQTDSFLRRMKTHRNAISSSYIHNAIRKYGWESFKVEILVIIDDIESRNQLEIDLITAYNTLAPNGYNLTTGGKYGKFTEKTLSKLRERKNSPAHNAAISLANALRPYNAESVRKCKETKLRKKLANGL